MKSGLSFAVAASLTTLGVSSSAFAGGFNDWGCRPAPGDLPVVFVHGRGGDAESMRKAASRLPGKCSFALNYGKMNGKGSNGMAHLDQSGGELANFANKVMAAAGTQQIDAVGYSEGGMVIDNYILTKGGGNRVRRYVGIAGAHYPYASEGVGVGATGTLYCPTLISFVRNSFPPFTSNISSKEIMQLAVTLAPNAFGTETEVVQSDFVVDLFDENYWLRTHGKLSEPITSAMNLQLADKIRTFHTPGATSPSTCYINVISLVDGFVGASTGYNDKNYNVLNFAEIGGAHGDVPGNDAMLNKMAWAFTVPITPGPTVNCGGVAPEADDLGYGSGGADGPGQGSNGGSNGVAGSDGAGGDPGADGSGGSGPTDPGGGGGGYGAGGNGAGGYGVGGYGGGADPNGGGDAGAPGAAGDPNVNGNDDGSAGGNGRSEPVNSEGSCSVGVVSSPATTSVGVAGLGLLGLALARRRRSRA